MAKAKKNLLTEEPIVKTTTQESEQITTYDGADLSQFKPAEELVTEETPVVTEELVTEEPATEELVPEVMEELIVEPVIEPVIEAVIEAPVEIQEVPVEVKVELQEQGAEEVAQWVSDRILEDIVNLRTESEEETIPTIIPEPIEAPKPRDIGSLSQSEMRHYMRTGILPQ